MTEAECSVARSRVRAVDRLSGWCSIPIALFLVSGCATTTTRDVTSARAELAKCERAGTEIDVADTPDERTRKSFCWELSTEQRFGTASSQYGLAYLYQHGIGVTKDEATAAILYRKSAEQGFSVAQDNLGVAYRDGIGVPKDPAEAMHWFRKGAEQNQRTAQYHLAQMVVHSDTCPKDFVEAYTWAHLASLQGEADATPLRDALFLLLTPEQVRGAESAAREWTVKFAEVAAKRDRR